MTEAKVFEKIRKVLIADEILNGYVGKRVYASHISTITKPKYPAVSLFLLSSGANFSVPTMSSMSIQIDLWMQATDYDTEDLLTCLYRVRALLHRCNLTDPTMDVLVQQCLERSVGNIMFEKENNLYHLPIIYEVVAI